MFNVILVRSSPTRERQFTSFNQQTTFQAADGRGGSATLESMNIAPGRNGPHDIELAVKYVHNTETPSSQTQSTSYAGIQL
jgi:hypothetical protein